MRVFPVLAALVALCLAPLSAARAADTVLAQTGSWVIAPVSGTLCTLKNVWQGGHELVFGRDAKKGVSVAVDFGADVLNPGQGYPLSLDLPPVLSRDVTAVAATRRVLLAGLGPDAAFADALGRMPALYLTVQGRSETAYALDGARDALRELAACAAGLSAPAKAAARAPQAKTKTKDDPLKKALAAAIGFVEEIPQAGAFNARVARWLAGRGHRCAGDFAHTDGLPFVQGTRTVQTAETACIGAARGTASALVFIGDGARLFVAEQDATLDTMPAALARRDALVTALESVP